jgi:hypothetical protein
MASACSGASCSSHVQLHATLSRQDRRHDRSHARSHANGRDRMRHRAAVSRRTTRPACSSTTRRSRRAVVGKAADGARVGETMACTIGRFEVAARAAARLAERLGQAVCAGRVGAAGLGLRRVRSGGRRVPHRGRRAIVAEALAEALRGSSGRSSCGSIAGGGRASEAAPLSPEPMIEMTPTTLHHGRRHDRVRVPQPAAIPHRDRARGRSSHHGRQ